TNSASSSCPPTILLPLPPPTRSTLFPYTTLFRSPIQISHEITRPLRAKRKRNRCFEAEDRYGPHWRQNQLRHGAARRRGYREDRSEEHTSELQSLAYLVCRLLLEKKKKEKKERRI